MARKKRRTAITREVPIKRYVPDNLELQYSDDVLIRHTEQAFYVNFQQVQHPLAITKAELEQIKEIRAKCVARIVLTPAQMKVTVDALKSNFEKYVKNYGDVTVNASELDATEIIATEAVEADVQETQTGSNE